MADLASLLQELQPRRRADPFEQQRKYAQMLMQQGASTEPVRTPLQGLARALTGAAGGVFGGIAENQQKQEGQKQIEGLTRVYNAKPGAEQDAAIADLSKIGDAESYLPILGNLLTQKMALQQKNALATQDYNAVGGLTSGQPPAPGVGGGQPPAPLTIDMKPLPSGSVPPGGFANNTGNIRATPGVNFPGQGAPQNGFMTFDSPQSGVNAQAGNFAAYVKQNPNITVAQALAKWAPPSENNTGAYINQIAESSGINPGMPLADVLKDPGTAAILLDAQTRLEKGGIPQGVTPDTFTQAAGGPPAQPGFTPTNTAAADVPGALTQLPAQGAGERPPTQAAPTPQAPQAPSVPPMPEISPAAQALEAQSQQAFRGGDPTRALQLRQKAQEVQATYAGERAKIENERNYAQGEEAQKAARAAAEHDRQQGNTTMSREQSDAATFADRMEMSNRTIGQLESQGQSVKGKALDSTIFGVGIPGANFAQSKEYQQFRQARENFAYAQLRRETGAAIQPFEYETIDKQYIPQPGDSPEVLAQKAQNRQVSLEGMKRAAGPTYALNPTVNRPPPGTQAPSATGAVPQAGAVMDGYRFKGGDPSKQENWERQ